MIVNRYWNHLIALIVADVGSGGGTQYKSCTSFISGCDRDHHFCSSRPITLDENEISVTQNVVKAAFIL